MKIERMHKASFGKIRAFFDLKTEEGIIIKGFKIIEGINGLFVSMPSEKNKDGDWQDSCYCTKDVRDKLNHLAVSHFESTPENTNTSSQKTENNQPQSDEAIPF